MITEHLILHPDKQMEDDLWMGTSIVNVISLIPSTVTNPLLFAYLLVNLIDIHEVNLK